MMRFANAIFGIAVLLWVGVPVFAANPGSVTIAGSLQSELGCAGDWDPACAATYLTYDAADDVWQAVFAPPPGNYEYKAALDNAWAENYGKNAQVNGSNISLNASGGPIKFYYDHTTHWITDNVNSIIAVAPGSFQSELGCPGDWDPSCLRSWLQDPDGNGIYEFTTTSLPAGAYEGKVALNESWDVNYGAGGAPNGANIPFTVKNNFDPVTFKYDSITHVLTISGPESSHDNNVEYDGLRHDSRDTLYRTPGGAVPAGTEVKIRFRSFHSDVSEVKLRLFNVNSNTDEQRAMEIAASDVPCYQDGIGSHTCDYWETTVQSDVPNNYWYRFIVTDGSKTAYYADNTPALDGGVGAPTDNLVDNSYALMFYDKNFKSSTWAKDAIMYQIFPDRFRNGRHNNDPHTDDVRYDDPVLALPWNTLPEGYCRSYTDASTNCPWRFDQTPPAGSPTVENPRGRDYMGGDLKGIDQQLDYLTWLGVNTIYMNPIFDSGSNHGYDTQDYTKVDPYFGTQKDFENLAKHATQNKVRLILDGVFNHLSSDSQFFDRYDHYSGVGACESVDSAFRSWFTFAPAAGGACAPYSGGVGATNYAGWFGFDSIPVITKSLPAVQDYFITGPSSITKYWLQQGSSGWRLDVMGDSSFPNGYWESFRNVVKQTKPDALIVGELWQKDTTLLRFLRGDRADSTMNYRLRDAVIGLLAPQDFDSKGFADSGHQIKPSEFAARLESQREDYSDATYYSLMNLLDSHDTARLLWVLTPGQNNRNEKEFNSANLEEGKRRLKLASLIQFAVPGAPTVYYGDEVGLTGADDPDDRRTYPWDDLGGMPDYSLRDHYRGLISVRKQVNALRAGDFRVLLADDDHETVAIGRKTGTQAALMLLNRSAQPQVVNVPLGGYVHDGVQFTALFAVGNTTGSMFNTSGGTLQATLEPESGLLLATGTVDLTPPAAPTGLNVTNESSKQVTLTWSPSAEAASYNVYRSVVSGGGWEKANTSPVTSTNYTVTDLTDGTTYYFVVRALDADGNESDASNEVSGIPHLQIGWANLQWPPTMTHTISATNRTDTAYGQVWIEGETSKPGATHGLQAQLGFGPQGSNPAGNPAWTWVDATFNTDAGNNDEYMASMLPMQVGTYDYVYRYSTTKGRDWLYADLGGPVPASSAPSNPGKLTVNSSGDTTAPSIPANLHVTSHTISNISLEWDPASDETSLFGYEVLRGTSAGGPYTSLATVSATNYSDSSVTANATYYYVVQAVDQSFNKSAPSNEAHATAQQRTVTLNFTVTVPATTDPTRQVYIAGFLDRLDGGYPQWDPGATPLTRVDATHWTISFTGKEGTNIEYKYTLGDWDHVEKDSSCGEIGNRLLTLDYGASGTQAVNDTVQNWRNVPPCGN